MVAMSESLTLKLAQLEDERAKLPAAIDAAVKDPTSSEDALTRLWARRERLPHLIEATRAQIAEGERQIAALAAQIDELRPVVDAVQREHDETTLAAEVYAAARARTGDRLGMIARKLHRIEAAHSELRGVVL
jgi:chromosome segregation ATPase